jgi:hypothetical protein
MVAIPRDDVKPCIAVEKTGLARTCPMSDARLRRPRGGREDRSSLGFSVPGAGTVCPSRTGSIALFGPLRGGAFPVDRPRREIGAVGSAEDHDFGWVAVRAKNPGPARLRPPCTPLRTSGPAGSDDPDGGRALTKRVGDSSVRGGEAKRPSMRLDGRTREGAATRPTQWRYGTTVIWAFSRGPLSIGAAPHAFLIDVAAT